MSPLMWNSSKGKNHSNRKQILLLLKYSWFTILYLFQVYSIMIQYFYRSCSIKSYDKIMAIISCAVQYIPLASANRFGVVWGRSGKGARSLPGSLKDVLGVTKMTTMARRASQGTQMVKNLPASAGDGGFSPWVRKIPWRGKWQPTPIFLPGKSHGQRSLAGYSPRSLRDTT